MQNHLLTALLFLLSLFPPATPMLAAVEADADTDAAAEEAEDEDKDEALVLRYIALAGSYVDHVTDQQAGAMDVLSGNSQKPRSLYELLRLIDRAAEESHIDGLFLNLSAGFIGLNEAQLAETWRRLQAFRTSGKTCVAWLHDAGPAHMQIASACEHVLLADCSTIDLPNPLMTSMHIKGSLDKLGITVSMRRAGQFKGAVEPLLRESMSDELRQHYGSFLRSLADNRDQRLASGRQRDRQDVRQWQQQRLFTAKEALQAGLVDELVVSGQLRQATAKRLGKAIRLMRKKKRSKKPTGFFELVNQILGAAPSSSSSDRPHLAVVHLQGPIVSGTSARSDRIVDQPTARLLRSLAKREALKGVIVRIDSPGGSASASEHVRQALADLAQSKAVTISMGGMAASGGYWIASIDAPIYAEAETLTGSIGVFGVKLSAADLASKLGLSMQTVSLDDASLMTLPDRAWSKADGERIQVLIDGIYTRFLATVAKARKQSPEQIDAVAQGRIWTGSQAQDKGLVDRIGGLSEALAAMKTDLKLADDIKVLHLPKAKTPMEELLALFGQDQARMLPLGWHSMLQAVRHVGINPTALEVLLQSQGQNSYWAMLPLTATP